MARTCIKEQSSSTEGFQLINSFAEKVPNLREINIHVSSSRALYQAVHSLAVPVPVGNGTVVTVGGIGSWPLGKAATQ